MERVYYFAEVDSEQKKTGTVGIVFATSLEDAAERVHVDFPAIKSFVWISPFEYTTSI